MIDKLHSHLDALKLRKMREILQTELRQAQAKKPSYSNFLLSLLLGAPLLFSPIIDEMKFPTLRSSPV